LIEDWKLDFQANVSVTLFQNITVSVFHAFEAIYCILMVVYF